MLSDSSGSGVQLTRRSWRTPELRLGDRRFKAEIGDAADVWDVIYSIVPAAEENEELRAELLDRVNDHRLVVACDFDGGEVRLFLFSRELLERALSRA